MNVKGTSPMNYGLIGEKLSHSYSKEIHEKIADYSYELCPIERKDLDAFMRRHDFRGINVTIPYKCDVIKYLDELSPQAEAIGAVNTIVNTGKKLIGYNTDYFGFSDLLDENEILPRGKKVLVLGNGGAAKAVIQVLADKQAKDILIVSRHPDKTMISYEEASRLNHDADIIVNTTPVGMYPHIDESPLDLTPFTKCEAVVDLIYNPEQTMLTAQAKNLGMKGVTGLRMLVSQAEHASKLFLEQH